MRVYRITLAVLILIVSAASLGFAAMTTDPPDSILLRSGYSSDATIGGLEARSIQFSLERTDFGWTGWMTLDPNQQRYSEFGHMTETTLMAGERIEITLSHFGTDETGRSCYAVVQNRFDPQMYVVFPDRPGGMYRLIIHGNGSFGSHVVFLEEERSNEIIAGAGRE